MDKAEGWLTIDEQRLVLANVLRDLTPEEWQVDSLCEGWTVHQAATHLTMAALAPNREVLAATVRARGSFNRMIKDSAVRRAARRPPEQVVADLESTVGSRRLAPTTFWRDPLLDVLVHSQDIVRPLGRRIVMPTDAARTALDWVWTRRFPFFPARAFRGIRLIAEDTDWRRGSGPELRGPVSSLLLLCTGRWIALDEVAGPGAELAARR